MTYIAKVNIGDVKAGEPIDEKIIGKDYVASYLAQGLIAEAKKVAKKK